MPVLLELADLGTILVLFGALIFIYLAVYIAKALFGVAGGTLGRLPIIGGWIDSSLHSVEHKIVSWMARAATGVDDAIGWSLHQQARLVDWLGREIRAHSNILYTLAALALGPGFAHAVRYEVAAIRRLLHATFGAQALSLHRLLRLERTIERGIGHDVLPRVRSLEREFTHVVEHDVASLRARTKALDREYTRLYKWMRSHPWTAVTEAFVGAVALALAKLGLDWIRCNTAKSVFKKHGCSLWSKIDGLLGMFAEVALVTNICTVLPYLETAFSTVAAPLIATLTDIGAGLCTAGSAPPELLPTIDLYLPAAPSATLYIP